MVEQRKSLPQAVPSSICFDTLVCSSPKSCSDLFSEPTLRVYPVSQCISSLGHESDRGVCVYVRCCRRSGGRRSWTTWRSLGRISDCAWIPEKNILTLELRLPQRRGVSGNDDELGLSSAQALEGRLVAEGDLTGLHHKRQARVDGVGGSLALLGGHRCV